MREEDFTTQMVWKYCAFAQVPTSEGTLAASFVPHFMHGSCWNCLECSRSVLCHLIYGSVYLLPEAKAVLGLFAFS